MGADEMYPIQAGACHCHTVTVFSPTEHRLVISAVAHQNPEHAVCTVLLPLEVTNVSPSSACICTTALPLCVAYTFPTPLQTNVVVPRFTTFPELYGQYVAGYPSEIFVYVYAADAVQGTSNKNMRKIRNIFRLRTPTIVNTNIKIIIYKYYFICERREIPGLIPRSPWEFIIITVIR
jgi:hypothetical protein